MDPELVAEVNRARAVLDLPELTIQDTGAGTPRVCDPNGVPADRRALVADGWNPIKQWRARKGTKTGGRFVDMPDVRAKIDLPKPDRPAAPRPGPTRPEPSLRELLDKRSPVPAAKPRPTPAATLLQMMQANPKGFTIRPDVGRFVTEGFAVALTHRGRVLPPGELNAEAVDRFIKDNWDFFENNPEAHIGGWVSDNELHLDAVEVLPDRDQAYKRARSKGELAIGDLAKYAAGDDGDIPIVYKGRPATGPARRKWERDRAEPEPKPSEPPEPSPPSGPDLLDEPDWTPDQAETVIQELATWVKGDRNQNQNRILALSDRLGVDIEAFIRQSKRPHFERYLKTEVMAAWAQRSLKDGLFKFDGEPREPTEVAKTGATFDELGLRPGRLQDRTVYPGPSLLNRFSRNEVVDRITAKLGKGYSDYAIAAGNVDLPVMGPREFAQATADMIEQRMKQFGDMMEIRVHHNHLRDVLDDRAVQNQFQTGTSQGVLDTRVRKHIESDALRYPVDGPLEARPVYGVKGTFDGLGMYGGVVLTLRDRVKDRATVTPWDSLDSRAHNAIPVRDLESGDVQPVDLLAAAGTGMPSGEDVVRWQSGDRSGFDVLDPSSILNPYVETQVFGGLPLSDVQKIEFDESVFTDPLTHPSADNLFTDMAGMRSDQIPRRVVDALNSMGVTKELFGKPGTPSREHFREVAKETVELLQQGKIDVPAQNPRFMDIVRQGLIARGAPEDVEVGIRWDPNRGRGKKP